MDPGDEVRLREIQREYLDFLDDDVTITTTKKKKKRIPKFSLNTYEKMVDKKAHRLFLSMCSIVRHASEIHLLKRAILFSLARSRLL